MRTGSQKQIEVLARPVLLFFAAALVMTLTTGTLQAQEHHPVTKANYTLAAQWTGARLSSRLHSTSVNPGWLEHSNRFWYRYESPAGANWFIVDPARKSKEPLFNSVRMAADLSRMTQDPYDHQHLPIGGFEFIDEDEAIRFSVRSTRPAAEDTAKTAESDTTESEGSSRNRTYRPTEKTLWFRYDLGSQRLTRLEDYEPEERELSWATFSPDSTKVLFARNHNLWMMERSEYDSLKAFEKEKEESRGDRGGRGQRGRSGQEAEETEGEEEQEEEEELEVEEVQLTTDGEEYYSYAGSSYERMNTAEFDSTERVRCSRVSWAPDSNRFSLSRTDNRKVKDLWVINVLANPRPTLETYRYAMPGEEEMPQTEVYVFDLAADSQTRINVELYKDQTVSVYTKRRDPTVRTPQPSIWMSENNRELWFSRQSRDMHKVDVCVADVETGEVRVVIEERLNTYIEMQGLVMLRDRNELVWWSERDGWGHYYLYGTDGRLKRQLTSGPWACRGITGIDEDDGVIYFTANAREAGEDPYFNHFYRIGLDGRGMKLLNPGEFDHRSSIDPNNRYFVDTFSRVNTAPVSALFNTDGEQLMELETADLSQLFEAGYQYPEPFVAKADDGITDLYGVMYKPFDFDPEKQYPIIAYVYPGPQTESVAKAFSTNSTTTSLAQFGFVVITLGNRGGHPSRSKWYHNYSYGDLRDYGLADKKTVIEQLAVRHSYIDVDRVGIFGHSGGGFMSTAALLVYPDFFKVAVSSSGNHENNIYNKWWSEKHHGVTEIINADGTVSFEYDIDKNSELAANLKGHLLLTTGDIDNNVHPGGTIRMANALIQAGKRFDLFIFPGARHGYGGMGNYFSWLRADYFCKHLLGDYSTSVDMIELLREQDQSPDAGRRSGGVVNRGGGRGG